MMRPPPLRSGLFSATVRHERFVPRAHRFAYGLFYLALDLDELPQIASRQRLLRINRRGVAAFWERDYFPFATTGGNLKTRVLAWCAERGHDVGPGGRVMLVTLPRIAGYLFNPVSFYFCAAADGRPVVAVAEVNNTFGETKPYLVPCTGDRGVFHARVGKAFYVSPFSSVDAAFDFTFRPPTDRLAIRIDDFEGGRRTLHSTLVGQRRPLTDALLAWQLVRHPLLTLRVTGAIHLQALRLWAKGVPHFAKAADADRQRGFFARNHALAHED